MAKKIQLFDLGDILSVTTGRIFSENGIDGIRALMGFMRRDEGYMGPVTMGIFQQKCSAALIKQFPFLKDLKYVGPNEKAMAWLTKLKKKYGGLLMVESLYDVQPLKKER